MAWIERGRGGFVDGRRQTDPGPPIPEDTPPPAPMLDGVDFIPIRCPKCGESAAETGLGRGIKIVKTMRPVRYHVCNNCAHRFKSVEVDAQ